MKRHLFIILFSAITLMGYSQTLIPIAPAYSQTSVNTAIFRNNSVVTHGEWQFASFYFFGSAWSGYDIRSWEEWQLHSRLFIESQRHPLVVIENKEYCERNNDINNVNR